MIYTVSEKIKVNGIVVKEIDTDYITYDRYGFIKEWLIWSEALNDWYPADLILIENRWPSKYERVVDEIALKIAQEEDL